MNRTVFHVPGMDCAAEEQLVRMQLGALPGVARLTFDLAARELVVLHGSDLPSIVAAAEGLRMGARLTDHREAVPTEDEAEPSRGDAAAREVQERRALWTVFGINAVLFAGEIIAGLLAGSMGLVADSLDMFADALVYGLSLWAVSAAYSRKQRAARLSGYLQFALAVGGLVEVTRRFVSPMEAPEPVAMIAVSLVALVGNVAALRVLSRAQSVEVHMEASRIFTSNDVKVNLLVIAAGVVVAATSSQIPDLVAGGLIFLVVASGARRILALSS